MSDNTNPATEALRTQLAAAQVQVEAAVEAEDAAAVGAVVAVVDQMLLGLGGVFNQLEAIQANFARLGEALCGPPEEPPESP